MNMDCDAVVWVTGSASATANMGQKSLRAMPEN